MNLLLDYTEFKRFINGMEEMLVREVRLSKEYQSFAAFFPESEMDRFIAHTLNEEGALEFQVSRMVHTEHIELCDRIVYSFYPEDVESYTPTDFQETIMRRIMNQDAFRMRKPHPDAVMECEVIPLVQDPDRPELYTEEELNILLREHEKTAEYNRNRKAREKIPQYFILREQLLLAALERLRRGSALSRAGFSVPWLHSREETSPGR